MRKKTKEESNKKKESSRWDMMYIPNCSWDFYDAFNKSRPFQESMKANESSIKGNNLEKYLTTVSNQHKESIRIHTFQAKPQIPPCITKLYPLQSIDGKFESLSDVLQCLEMPRDIVFERGGAYKEWEIATSVVVALIRQHTELSEHLMDFHDKAARWIRSNEIVYEARELINRYMGTVPWESYQETERNEEIISSSSQVNAIDDPITMANTLANTLTTPLDNTLSNTTTNNLTNTLNNPSMVSSISKEQETIDYFPSMTKDSITFDSLLQSSIDSKGNINNIEDNEQIIAQRKLTQEIEIQVVELCMKIESLQQEIEQCLLRCIQAYNTSELYVDRYRTFDELTARLGQGFEPTAAYSDWRAKGVPGLRPMLFLFFNTLQHMAEERLTLLELYQPLGRNWSKQLHIEHNKSRWKLIWNGQDIVLKVLHSFDFLRKCRELSDWYGPSFYFIANPLMLPFPMMMALDQLDLQPKIKELLHSQPYARIGLGNPTYKTHWQHKQYLNKFRRQFQLLIEEKSFNWPELPDVRYDEINESMFTSLLILCLCCEDSIRVSYQWERKFKNKISTIRGQNELLLGESNLRDDKPLKIPLPEERKQHLHQLPTLPSKLKKKLHKEVHENQEDLEDQGEINQKNPNKDLQQNSFFSIGMESSTSNEINIPMMTTSQELETKLRPNLQKAKQFANLIKASGGLLTTMNQNNQNNQKETNKDKRKTSVLGNTNNTNNNRKSSLVNTPNNNINNNSPIHMRKPSRIGSPSPTNTNTNTNRLSILRKPSSTLSSSSPLLHTTININDSSGSKILPSNSKSTLSNDSNPKKKPITPTNITNTTNTTNITNPLNETTLPSSSSPIKQPKKSILNKKKNSMISVMLPNSPQTNSETKDDHNIMIEPTINKDTKPSKLIKRTTGISSLKSEKTSSSSSSSTTFLLNRESLAREASQSRKVSRVPMTSMIQPLTMIKDRPHSSQQQSINNHNNHNQNNNQNIISSSRPGTRSSISRPLSSSSTTTNLNPIHNNNKNKRSSVISSPTKT